MKTSLCLTGVRLPVDDDRHLYDILVTDGVITAIERHLFSLPTDTTIVDGEGALLLPAMTDLISFPDTTETPETALSSLRRGGYARALRLSTDTRGDVFSPDAPFYSVPRFPDDPKSLETEPSPLIWDGGLSYDLGYLRELYRAAAEQNKTVISTVCEPSLLSRGVLAEGRSSKLFRVPSISPLCELMPLTRDLLLSEDSHCRLHIAAVSTARAVGMIAEAKKKGLAVSCGVSPFHLAFTEEDVAFYGSAAKLLPPLRTHADREVLAEGLYDGTVDALSSLHTPLAPKDKEGSLAAAAFGCVSHDLALPALLTFCPSLIDRPARLCRAVCGFPASLLGLDTSLTVGARADLILVDPRRELVVSKHTLRTRAINTPFLGMTLTSSVVASCIGGVLV